MGKSGPEFYDDDAVFATYMARRDDPPNANETMEKPVFLELIGDLAGLRILDLGCGDARFGREALRQRCCSYVGLEGSRNMAQAARFALAGTDGEVIHATMERWTYPTECFDLVTSRLALHYIENIYSIFGGVYGALVPGGRFVFSVEHPIITSCDRARRPGQVRQEWIVDDYFETGPRVTSWMGGRVIKYHRTVEDYFSALRAVGFAVEDLRESRPRRGAIADEATYRRRMRIPLLLFFVARRPVGGDF